MPIGCSITSQDHIPILCSLLFIIAHTKSLKLATNLSKNPPQFHSLGHRTVYHWKPVCIAPPISMKHRCDDYVILFLSLKFGFFPLFSALFSCFASYEQYLIVEASFIYIIQPPLIRITKCFYVFAHHLQSLVKKLLKSNCRFGAKKCRNCRFVSKSEVSLSLPSLDSQLNFFSCILIWFVDILKCPTHFLFKIEKCH